MAKSTFAEIEDTSANSINDVEALKEATSTTGIRASSIFSSFQKNEIIRVAPVGNKHFRFKPEHEFEENGRVYKEASLFIYKNLDMRPEQVPYARRFRSKPATAGAEDLLHQLLVEKTIFKISGYTEEGRPVYEKLPNPCTYFDDPQDINTMRMSPLVSDFDVITALAGSAWKVVDVIIAETRRFRKGVPPLQRYMYIPILKRVGEWDDKF